MAGMIRTFIIWLHLRAHKMKRILRSDWLPERARWSCLARSVFPSLVRKKSYLFGHKINLLLTTLLRSRWLIIGLVRFCVFIDLVFVSVYENAKKKELGQYSAILNEDAWSITHTNKQLNLAHEKKDCLAG